MTLLVLVLAWDTVRREQGYPPRAALRAVPLVPLTGLGALCLPCGAVTVGLAW
ncbi:MAG: hypothetical protein ACLGI2_01655 [Acidimicrobiia bacterium]